MIVEIYLRTMGQFKKAAEANEISGATWKIEPERQRRKGQHTNGPEDYCGALVVDPEWLQHWLDYVRPHNYEICDD